MTAGEDGKDRLNMKFSTPGGSEYSAVPKLYFNTTSNGLMREPEIQTFPLQDIYISPLEKPEQERNDLVLGKDETVDFNKYRIHFVDFELGNHGSRDSIRVAARIEVTAEGITTTLSPAMIIAKGKRKADALSLPTLSSKAGGGAFISLEGVDVTAKSVHLTIADDNSDQVVVEVSMKPFMNVLWLGAIVMVVGVGVAIVKRLQCDPLM